jgi:hypothetical protein
MDQTVTASAKKPMTANARPRFILMGTIKREREPDCKGKAFRGTSRAMAKKRKRGRPVATDPHSAKIEVLCTPAEKAAWKAAAGGQKVSAWARSLLNAAANRVTAAGE